MSLNNKPTGLCFFPAFDWAISPTHPEREERLLYTYDQITEEGILDWECFKEYQPQKIEDNLFNQTHFLIPDVASNLTDSHRVATGGAIVLADALMQQEIKNGFALVRPPGHHAVKLVYGNRGFCNVNHEAIIVDYLRHKYGIKRVAIVDTDCHHGDGTQDVFWHDPDVLCISIHQDGRTLYPGTGFVHEAGGPTAYGSTLNFPLPPNTGDEGFLITMEEGVLPILQDFKPEIIINSAGQDNHYTDPLTNMNFSAGGYAKLTQILQPHLSVLEGGYSIEGALPYVNLGILLALAGQDYSFVKEPDFSLQKVAQNKEHSSYIRQIIKQVHEVYQHRGKKNDTGYKKEQGYFVKEKSIFYDTDGIRDLQQEKIKDCTHCSGLVLTFSKCPEKALKALCLFVPFNACKNCEDEAQGVFESYQPEGKREVVLFQNQKTNVFLRKN